MKDDYRQHRAVSKEIARGENSCQDHCPPLTEPHLGVRGGWGMLSIESQVSKTGQSGEQLSKEKSTVLM